MLDHHPVLHLLFCIGALGLAAMTPRDGHALWWTALVTAPVALGLLGAGISSESSTDRWQRRGAIVERLGAGLYVLLYVLGLGRCIAVTPPAWPLFVTLGGLGLGYPAALARQAWFDAQGQLAPPLPNGMPLFMISVGGLFSTAGLGSTVSGRTDPLQGLTSIVFFGAVALMGVSQWLTDRALQTGEGGALRHRLLWAAVLLFGAALLLFAWGWPDLHVVMRVVFGAAGAIAVVAPGVRALGLRRGHSTFTAEGLLVITGRDAVLWPWECVDAVSVGLWHGNEALFVDFVPGAVPIPLRGGGDATERHLRSVAQSGPLTGHDLALMEVMLDASPLEILRQLERPDELPSVDDALRP